MLNPVKTVVGVDYFEMDHLRNALEVLDVFEAIVNDGCYTERIERLIGKLRAELDGNLAAIERSIVNGADRNEYL